MDGGRTEGLTHCLTIAEMATFHFLTLIFVQNLSYYAQDNMVDLIGRSDKET